MSLKISFFNPNTEQEVDKYLPKILAEAVINKIAKERNEVTIDKDAGCKVKHSA